ncbi:hypothetical protein V6N11_012033 [Hibiscus sabdariffa]|uniref:Cytochrome P450 n=1 Tax=Hibiscus sabdariffa TaxID=183260 RepID=A0ABR1ZUT9_9ROSI
MLATPSTLLAHCPSSMALLFTIVAALAIFWFTWTYRKCKGKPRPSPPGPRGLPIVGILPFLRPDLHSYFADLARSYGPVVKLQLGSKLAFLVTSPTAAREVLKDQDIVFANRDVPTTVKVFSGGRDIVWNPYGPEWRMLRKVCVIKLLGNATLDKTYELRRREVRQTPWCRVQAGHLGNIRAFGNAQYFGFLPGAGPLDLQGVVKRMKKPMGKLYAIIDNIIEERLKESGSSSASAMEFKDFVQFLLQLKDEEDCKPPLTMNLIKDLLLDMVVGGSDTSSNTIEFTMAEIINKPEVMIKAQQELDEVVGKNNLVEESHIQKLPYLLAIMKESLRLHPVLPLLVPHCPSEPCTVGGYHIPKGSRVFINAWAIHRDPSIWENPLEFNPSRFLNSPWDFGGSGFGYFPFGSGRRNCAGIAMAERTVLHSVATLLHSFNWKVPHGNKLDLSEKFGIVMKLKNPLIAVPTPRLSDTTLYE